MGALDVNLFGDLGAAARFEEKFVALDAAAVLRLAIKDLFPGRVALVSSFGADSAVLLHMVAGIDRATPVIFVDSGYLFPETLAYRDELVALLGLTDVRSVMATPEELAALDPEGFLWSSDPDRCCALRKVAPLGRAVEGFDAWITGRKRFQADTRASLPLFETEGDRVKINPLAGWDATKLLHYLDEHGLPRHRMVAKGYPSIGCIPCTSAVRPGEDARAGRWRGKAKTECGIHLGVVNGGGGI
ncbi:phosphoadenylyl-sulfate reductase [Lichenihabitans sp. Uapishka_5]|uniref:phosphoadenylyl-sulfate reductase n=1 Tax=Lichenihabitans sp. Uapishka_5 TaxID=3037302 RepID=UPI0029E80119|nr:phosphoadenylyl-sulfate reductase [Lichenihabitans sp. Uapishka_5]MDX7952687.1 phosphoadenylyl-sulfate reductase [Lichenihabitans sp. Uapishka_5]